MFEGGVLNLLATVIKTDKIKLYKFCNSARWFIKILMTSSILETLIEYKTYEIEFFWFISTKAELLFAGKVQIYP